MIWFIDLYNTMHTEISMDVHLHTTVSGFSDVGDGKYTCKCGVHPIHGRAWFSQTLPTSFSVAGYCKVVCDAEVLTDIIDTLQMSENTVVQSNVFGFDLGDCYNT